MGDRETRTINNGSYQLGYNNLSGWTNFLGENAGMLVDNQVEFGVNAQFYDAFYKDPEGHYFSVNPLYLYLRPYFSDSTDKRWDLSYMELSAGYMQTIPQEFGREVPFLGAGGKLSYFHDWDLENGGKFFLAQASFAVGSVANMDFGSEGFDNVSTFGSGEAGVIVNAEARLKPIDMLEFGGKVFYLEYREHGADHKIRSEDMTFGFLGNIGLRLGRFKANGIYAYRERGTSFDMGEGSHRLYTDLGLTLYRGYGFEGRLGASFSHFQSTMFYDAPLSWNWWNSLDLGEPPSEHTITSKNEQDIALAYLGLGYEDFFLNLGGGFIIQDIRRDSEYSDLRPHEVMKDTSSCFFINTGFEWGE